MITREHRELEDAVRKVVMMDEQIKRTKKLEAIAEAARVFCSSETMWTIDRDKLKAAVDALYGEKNEER